MSIASADASAIKSETKGSESDAKHGGERRRRVFDADWRSKTIGGLDDLMPRSRSLHGAQNHARRGRCLHRRRLRMLGIAAAAGGTMRGRMVSVTTTRHAAGYRGDSGWPRKTHDRQHCANHRKQDEDR